MIPAEDRPVGPSRVMKIVSPPSGAEETTDDGWDAAADAQGGADDNAQGSDGVAVGEGAGSDDAWERPKKAYASAARDDGWQSVPVKAKGGFEVGRQAGPIANAPPRGSSSSTHLAQPLLRALLVLGPRLALGFGLVDAHQDPAQKRGRVRAQGRRQGRGRARAARAPRSAQARAGARARRAAAQEKDDRAGRQDAQRGHDRERQ